jgi:hypothetical protein
MSPAQATFHHLGVALEIGLLIGIEGGWAERDEEEVAESPASAPLP